MKSNYSLDSVLGSLKWQRQGSDMLTVADGTDWKTETESRQFVKDFTFKCGFLFNTNVNNAV